MKIEVTFEKNAKKEFREECVKRLKSFVHQIKTQKQNQSSSTSQKSNTAYEMFKMDKALLQKPMSKRDNGKQQKALKQYQSEYIDEQHVKSQQIEDVRKFGDKQNRNCIISKIPNDIRIQVKDQNNSSIKQMNDKVNMILQKFEKVEKINRENSNSIQDKLELTNRKLDYLIKIAQKRVYPFNESPQYIKNTTTSETKREQFQQKFLQLTNKYNRILQNNIQLKSSFYHSKFSPQQTRDSLTFRQI